MQWSSEISIKKNISRLRTSEELCKDLTEALEKERVKCAFCEAKITADGFILRVKNIRALAFLCAACSDKPDILNELNFVFANICELSDSIIEDLEAV